MKIDLMSALYNISMILLIFTAALVATKSIGKWVKQGKEEEDKEEQEDKKE
ncbi:MAG: hypothetical protein U9R26_01790 [Campylobacterota bacterium]|nr:hypothetical protein [Campylobacterota bacterium]